MSAFRSKAYGSTAFFKAVGLAWVIGSARAAGATPARAQLFGWWGAHYSQPAAMPAELISRRLAQQGYRVLRLQRNGGVFLADVSEGRGRTLRLVVDSRDGSILQRFATAAVRNDGRAPGVYDMSPDTGLGSLAPPSPVPAPVPDRPSRRAAPRAPAEAVLDPGETSSPSSRKHPAPVPSKAMSLPAGEPDGSARPSETPSTAAAGSAPSPAPAPAPVRLQPPPAPAPATANKPGYATGVPINPLD